MPEKFVSRAYGTSIDQTASKPLILFEDVDALLSEDHGLIATIQKLAETAKRPIILTSNSKKSNWLNKFYFQIKLVYQDLISTVVDIFQITVLSCPITWTGLNCVLLYHQ